MKPEEIKKLIETTIQNELEYYWVYILISALLAVFAAFFIEYFKNRGKNLATKKDIKDITHKIESVKSEIQKQQEIEKQKRQLKYDALLNALIIIDAHLSHFLKASEGQRISKQYASTEDVRKCHNNLILTCENTELFISVRKF